MIGITPFLSHPSKSLEQKILDLLQLDGQLDYAIPKTIRQDLIYFLRFMNSYYSNRIEGNSTRPKELLQLAASPLQESLQQSTQSKDKREILRHIEVQLHLAKNPFLPSQVATAKFIQYLHQQFYANCSPEDLIIQDKDTPTTHYIVPGEYRNTLVEVGRHIPPKPEDIQAYMRWFSEFYNIAHQDGINKFYAAAASHHRLAWIHPFLDGNGRVTRLFTDSFMQACGLKTYGVWTMARGFSRHADEYFKQLALADYPRQGISDGRGILSDRGLESFSCFFYNTAIDQIRFFIDLLEPEQLATRLEYYFQLRIQGALPQQNKLPKESLFIYKTLLFEGSRPRLFFQNSLHISERKLRDIIKLMVSDGLIIAPHKSDLQVKLPTKIIDYLFPRLLSD